MNCQTVQRKITENLAAGASVLSRDLSEHREGCAECQVFYENQRNLFQSLDAALQYVVNQPVPTSLLPRVRAQLEQAPVRHSFWMPGWSFVALSATVVLALALGLVWNSSNRRSVVPERNAGTSGVARQLTAGPEVTSTVRSSPSSAVPPPKAASVLRARVLKADSDVVVLAEEREAFARYVAGRASGRGIGAAMAHAGRERDNDQPVEIARLQIEEIAISPLESEDRQ